MPPAGRRAMLEFKKLLEEMRVDREKMTVKELRAIALEIPRAVAVHDMKKAELIACIKEARGIKDEAPVKIRKKVVAKIKLSKNEIKGKIKQLKEEKKAAQAAKNRKLKDILRRRISHLKKQTRKFAAA